MGRIIHIERDRCRSVSRQILILTQTGTRFTAMNMKVKTFTPGMKFTESTKPKRISQNEVESYLDREVRKLGGETHKWFAKGRAGVHDRIVLFPQDEIWLVEAKAPDGSKSPHQKDFHNHLYHDMQYTRSVTVWCYEDVDRWIEIRSRWNSLTMSEHDLDDFTALQIGRLRR